MQRQITPLKHAACFFKQLNLNGHTEHAEDNLFLTASHKRELPAWAALVRINHSNLAALRHSVTKDVEV